MLKLGQLMEGYENEVKKTVEKDMRLRAKRAYQRSVDKQGDTSLLPDEDLTNPDWQNAVVDSIDGKEVVQDPKWNLDPVETADKYIHMAFMSWIEIA